MKDHFVIHDGEIYINKILSRIAKYTSNHKKDHKKSIIMLFHVVLVMIIGGNEICLVQFYEDVHMRKDARFIEGTQAQDFVEDAKATVDMLATSDGSKSRKEVENEVF
ncbi:Periplasmic oligopeptide-binding protein [Bienertia sinuspersici]